MTDPLTRAAPPGARSRLARQAGAALAVLGGGALAWQGGLAGLLGLAATGALVPWLLRGVSADAAGGPDQPGAALDEPRVSGGRVGAEVMVAQVVPVWGKQLDVTRDTASDGLGRLLETFAAMSGTLGTLAQQLDQGRPTLDAGAIEDVLADGSPSHAALAALMAPSQRAFAQRDAAVAELSQCADAVTELRQLGRQAREIGKHTRLVAFNASIEANRGSGQAGQAIDSGAPAIANETRMLAGRMAEVGEQIERLVSRLEKTLSPARLHGEINDTPADELQLELTLRARESLNALMAGLGGAMHSSNEVRSAATALQAQLEETFVMFQFGDRVSQMLSIVSNDMQNFGRWVDANPYATQSDAADWLANLERSYTMDEQRSQHHGNVHVDRGSEIEFF